MLIDGRPTRSCTTRVAAAVGKQVRTIDALTPNGHLHPLQEALLHQGAMQCGYCTPGMIMSGVALIAEARAGWPSAATVDVTKPFALADLSAKEIRERMSGNLCRCGTYPKVFAATLDAAQQRAQASVLVDLDTGTEA